MTTKSSFKVDKPSSFDGTKSKYDAWRVECQLFFLAHEQDIDTDAKKIVSTLSYMKGGLAEKWKTRYVSIDMAKPGYTAHYGNFTSALDKAFIETNKAQKAVDALNRLQQGKRTADEYTADFRVLLSDTNIHDDRAAINFYQAGLNVPLVDRMYGIYPLPDTLDSWIDHAIQFDTQYRDRLAQKRGKTPTPWHSDNKKSKDPDAMDVDKRQNRTAPAKLTPVEREKCFKEGRCFACREKGHNATNCPQKKTWNNRSGSTRGQTRVIKEESDGEGSPPPPHIRTQRPTHNPEAGPSTRTSESPPDDEPPTYNRVASARSRIHNILSQLPADQRSEVATLIDEDF